MTEPAVASAEPFASRHPSPTHATTVVLRDGSVIGVRALHPNDEPAVREFLRGLSQQSRWLRFCGQLGDEALMREAHRQAHVEETRGLGLVATAGEEERIVGHAEYAGVRDDRAEVSFAIADACQGQGLATILVGQLAQLASDRGIRTFEAEVLPENHKMLAVFRESGFPIRTHAMRGNIHIEFPTAITEAARERFEERDWTAAVNAMHAFFNPARWR